MMCLDLLRQRKGLALDLCMLGQKERRSCDRRFVPREGLEPSRPCEQQILSLPCLPFHHQGLSLMGYWLLFIVYKFSESASITPHL